MACATLGCGKQPASSRAKFCRQCFLESARTNSLKRQSFRGGRGGVVGNKGNITMDVFMDVAKGMLTFHRKPDWSVEKAKEGGYVMKRHSGGRGGIGRCSRKRRRLATPVL